MKTHRWFAVALSIVVPLACGGCGDEPEKQAVKPVRLSLLYRSSSTFGKAAIKWANLVEKRSGGKIAIDVYPEGELLKGVGGGQVDLLVSGGADLAVVNPAEFVGRAPSLNVLYLPFLFPNFRSVNAVLQGDVGSRLLGDVGGAGVKGLAFMPGPFLQLCSTKRVVKPEELNGLRMRYPRQGAGRYADSAILPSLGVRIVDVGSGDLQKAIRGGQINAEITTLKRYGHIARKHMDNVTLLNYSVKPMVVCASAEYWSRLTGGERRLLSATLEETIDYQVALLSDDSSKRVEKLVDGGADVVSLIPEEQAKFRRAVEEKYPDLLDRAGSELLDRIKARIETSEEPFLYRFWDKVEEARVYAPPFLPKLYPDEDNEMVPPDGQGGVVASAVHDSDYTVRKAILVPVPSSLVYEVRVPSAPRLTFGIGLRADEGVSPTDSVTFDVDVLEEGKGHISRIFSKSIDPRPDAGAAAAENDTDYGRWSDVKLNLGAFAGKRVKITLRVRREGSGNGGGSYYEARWSNPVLYQQESSRNHRNIILISLDTLRADRLGSYGNERETSPAIDRLAEEGTLFRDALSQATWTLPSHMSIMTSLYPFQHGFIDGRVIIAQRQIANYVTLAGVLRNKGYNTVAFTEGLYVASIYGFSQGFNSYGNSRGITQAQEDIFQHVQDLDDINEIFRDSRRNIQTTFFEASRWLFNNDDQKFFMFLHTYEVHLPYFPNFYVSEFDPDYRGSIGNVLDIATWQELEARGRFTEADVTHLTAMYDAQIRFTDGFISKFLRVLDELDLTRDTLVVVTSDHGERIWSKGYLLKHGHDPHEEVLRVPLIMTCPSIVLAGQEINTPVALIDIAPTLLEFAGTEAPPHMEGISLYDAVTTGSPLAEGRPLYAEDKPINRVVSLRVGDMKLFYYISNDRCKLYDLSSDPNELVDIAEMNKNLAENSKRTVKRFIKSKPIGFFLAFTGAGKERVFEGKVATEGIFSLVDAYDLTAGRDHFSVDEEKDSMVFKIKAGNGDSPVINFRTSPEDAEVTLDLRIDGKRAPGKVYLGKGMTSPAELPCVLAASPLKTENITSPAAMEEPGCYVNYISPHGLDDSEHEAIVKLADMEAERAVPAGRRPMPSIETEVDRGKEIERHLEGLRALGYLD